MALRLGSAPALAVLLALPAAVASSVAPARAQATPEERIAAYATRIERLEDQHAIEVLQASYGYYFDKGLWREVADLFAADASFEYGMRGVYLGRERIYRAHHVFGPEGLAPGHLVTHMQLQPIISVGDDGRTAAARWQGPVMLAEPGHNGIWGVGIYENTYVKQAGRWLIQSLRFYPTAFTDYDQGWARSTLPMAGTSALFPPDRPPSTSFRALPGRYIPPFSFRHPVTGEQIAITQPEDSVARPPARGAGQ